MALDTYRTETFAQSEPRRRRGADYIWLVYSVFYFLEPARRGSALYWAQCLAIFAVFLPVYVWFVETKTPRIRLPLLGVICLFGLATIHFNEGASFFLIFAAALIPFAVNSLQLGALLIVAESVIVAAEWSVLRENPLNFGVAFGCIYVVGLGNLSVAEQKRAACRLLEAQAENAALAAVAERERIARDLHDVLGHTLSVIVLKAELAGRLLALDLQQLDPQQLNTQRAAVEIADVERTARTALAEVRETIGGFRSPGLAAEMSIARQALDAAGVTLTIAEIDSSASVRVLDQEMQTVFSLTLREAVTNIVRHAHATHCRVSFTTVEGRHALSIEDDGVHAAPREGNGLRGMRERVQRLGGQFRLDTTGGTRLRVELPAAVSR